MNVVASYVLAALALAAPRPASESRLIYWVDVERAAVRTKRGQELLAQLEETRARFEEKVKPLEDELTALRNAPTERTSPLRRRRENVERALEELLAQEEAHLIELEQSGIHPTLETLRATLRSWNEEHPPSVIVALDEYPLANPPTACDATEWLIGAHETGKAKALPAKDECRTRFFLYVDLSRLKYEIKSSEGTQRELEALKKQRDRTSTATAGEPISRIELFAKYSTEGRERRERERVQEERLRLAALSFIARTAAKLPGIRFVDLQSTDHERLEPSCEVTSWMIELERGAAELADLGGACRCLWLGRTGKLQIAQDCRQPKPNTRYRLGDFVVYRYSGTFSAAPVTLREEIKEKDGNRLTIEVEARRGAETRRWIQVVTDTPENQANNVIDELYEIVDGERRRLANEDNRDLYRLYEWTLVMPDGRPSGLSRSKVEVSIGGQRFTCERTTGKNTLRGELMRFESHTCPGFVWTHGPAKMIDLTTKEEILRVEIESWGTRRTAGSGR